MAGYDIVENSLMFRARMSGKIMNIMFDNTNEEERRETIDEIMKHTNSLFS